MSAEVSPDRELFDRLPLIKHALHKQPKQPDTRFAPRITKDLAAALDAVEGSVMLLAVEFASQPACEIMWYKNGFHIQSSEDFHIESTLTGTSLRIRETFKSDSGTYLVKLVNEMGQTQASTQLTVKPGST